MKVREIMTSNVECLDPTSSLKEVAQEMKSLDVGFIPICENDRLVGTVTDRDIVIRAVADGELNRPVREIVSGEVVTARPDMSTREAAQLMSEHQVRRLPVVENERLVGIVSIGDLAVKDGNDKRIGDALEEISQGVKEKG